MESFPIKNSFHLHLIFLSANFFVLIFFGPLCFGVFALTLFIFVETDWPFHCHGLKERVKNLTAFCNYFIVGFPFTVYASENKWNFISFNSLLISSYVLSWVMGHGFEHIFGNYSASLDLNISANTYSNIKMNLERWCRKKIKFRSLLLISIIQVHLKCSHYYRGLCTSLIIYYTKNRWRIVLIKNQVIIYYFVSILPLLWNIIYYPMHLLKY